MDPSALQKTRDALRMAGFVAADDEAKELVAAADGDETALQALLERRLGGEPLAWITGSTRFLGTMVHVAPGVYVPRWQSEALARRAITLLPANGVAVDLCTGSGAISAVLGAARPSARVIGTDIDPRAIACARRNGVEAYTGDLFEPLPLDCIGSVDVVVAVVPYVPTPELERLPRDTFRYESPLAYDGGSDGLAILRRVAHGAHRVLAPNGSLLIELGPDQIDSFSAELVDHSFTIIDHLTDGDGEVRGIEARSVPTRPHAR